MLNDVSYVKPQSLRLDQSKGKSSQTAVKVGAIMLSSNVSLDLYFKLLVVFFVSHSKRLCSEFFRVIFALYNYNYILWSIQGLVIQS